VVVVEPQSNWSCQIWPSAWPVTQPWLLGNFLTNMVAGASSRCQGRQLQTIIEERCDWMHPWTAGNQWQRRRNPASWHLDDAPATMFVKKFPNSHGWVTGQALGQICRTSLTGSTTTTTTQCSDRHPPGFRRQAACADDARAATRPHAVAPGVRMW